MTTMLTAVFNVRTKPGQGAALISTITEMTKVIEEQVPGLLSYQVFSPDDGDNYILVERFANSDVVLKTGKIAAGFAPRIMESCEILSCCVGGPVSEAAQEHLSAFGASFDPSPIGFDRAA